VLLLFFFLLFLHSGLNQIYDLDIDAVNKPLRPLPSHRMSLRFAWIVSIIYFLAALIPPLFLSLIPSSPLSQYSYHVASVFAGHLNTHGCFLAFCGGASTLLNY
jgi:4-hydroxybenzoate polyprenyltransferase